MKSFASFSNVIKHQQGFQSARKMLTKLEDSMKPEINLTVEPFQYQLQPLDDSYEVSSYCAYDSNLQQQCRINILQEQIKQTKYDLQKTLKYIKDFELKMRKLERNADQILLTSYNSLKQK